MNFDRSQNKPVFLPETDELLNAGAVDGALVPFQTDFLAPKKDRKPRNWITPSSYEDAMKRLQAWSAEHRANPESTVSPA